jgi:hypothetical protein
MKNNLSVILCVSICVLAGLLSSYKLYHDRKLTLKLFILNTCISAAVAAFCICILFKIKFTF